MEKARLIERITAILKERSPSISEKEICTFCIGAIGCAQSSYYNYKALLNENVSVDVQDLVAEGKVSSTVVRNLSKKVKDPSELTKTIFGLVKDAQKAVESGTKASAKVKPSTAPKKFQHLRVGKKVEQFAIELLDSPSEKGQFLLKVITQLQDKETTLEAIVAQVNAE